MEISIGKTSLVNVNKSTGKCAFTKRFLFIFCIDNPAPNTQGFKSGKQPPR